MLVDLAVADDVVEANPLGLRAEVCVIGGGIAGLVLANRLALQGVDVALLESGGAGPSVPAEVDVVGEAYPGASEGGTRALGGSSLVWGGQLLPMLEGGNWPVSLDEIAAFYVDVERIFGVDDLPYEAPSFLQAAAHAVPSVLAQFPRLLPRVSKFAAFSQRNLGATLGKQVGQHALVRLYLHATVTELVVAPGGDRVRNVVFRSPSGKSHRVSAQRVVIAAGAVETCRLLLASRSVSPEGIGNRFDQVGRNPHDHLTMDVAHFGGEARERAVSLFRPWIVGGTGGTLHALKLEAHYKLRRKLGLHHAQAHFTFEEPEGSGVAVLRSFLRDRQRGEGRHLPPLSALPQAGLEALRLRTEAKKLGRRFLSARASVGLRINVAQGIPSSSRVRLSDRRDSAGQPLAQVEWHTQPAEQRSIRVFADYVRRRFSDLGFLSVTWNPDALPMRRELRARGLAGRVWRELERPMPGLEDARHPMGGTCMGLDPQASVVDADLRVHGIENLWVASTAVFPDGRAQLPTMTLMALAMRLGDRLASEIRRTK